MNLLDILSPKAIKVPLNATDKHGAIDELVDLLHDQGLTSDPSSLKRVVWEREQQRSTGIGEGLAIPHGKCGSCNRLVMAMGRPTEALEFGAVDNKPVRLVVLLASPPNRTAEHIQALGKISRMMIDPETRNRAYLADTPDQLYDLVKQFES